MANTIQSRIEDYVGTFSDTDALTAWASEGIKIIADRFSPDMLERLASAETEAGSGVALTNKKLLRAYNFLGNPARNIPPYLKTKVATSGSLYEVTDNDPVFYNEDKVYVLPANSLNKVVTYTYPTPVVSTNTVAGFADEYLDGVIVFAAIRAANSLLTVALGAVTAPSISSMIIAPELPSFSYTDAVIGTYSLTTVGSLGNPPVYNPPVFSGDYSAIYGLDSNQEDVELANAQMGEVGLKVNEYQADLQNAINQFNQENVVYQSSIQTAITNAQLAQQEILALADKTTDLNLQNEFKELERQIAEYRNKLDKYQIEFQSYSAMVQAELGLGNFNLGLLGNKIQTYVGLIQQLKAEWMQFLQLNFNIGEK